VSWDEPLNDQGQPIAVAGYEVEYRVENGVYQGTKSVTTLNTIFTALAIGNFQARVRSVSSNGRRSVWVESNIAAITQQSSIIAVIAQATTTTPQEGTVVNLSAIVNGLGSYSTAVTWTIEASSTAIGTLDTQNQTVTYTVPPSSAGMLSRLRATSVQDQTKFGEVVLNIQAATAPPPGTTQWRSVGNVATLLNNDRVYAGAVGLSQLTLPTNAPIFSEITIVNNGGSTGFEIIPPSGVSIVHQGVSRQDKLATTQNPTYIRLLCTNAPNEWTVIEFSGVFAFIDSVPLTIIGVVANASPSSVEQGETSQLSAVVSGTGPFDTSVTWSIVSGPGALNGSVLTATGAGTIVVEATSVQDPSKTGTISVESTAIQTVVTTGYVTKSFGAFRINQGVSEGLQNGVTTIFYISNPNLQVEGFVALYSDAGPGVWGLFVKTEFDEYLVIADIDEDLQLYNWTDYMLSESEYLAAKSSPSATVLTIV
jgi:hypothetical protein